MNRLVSLFILLSGLWPAIEAQSQTTRWADTLIDFSSQYSSSYYSAGQATGPPDTPPDLQEPAPQAWSPLEPDNGEAFIRLGFTQGLSAVQQIAIVESHHPGAIYRVFLESGARSWMVHEVLRPTPAAQPYRIYRIFLDATPYTVTGIRIVLNTARAPGFNHLDAVGITDGRQPIEPVIALADVEAAGEREWLGPAINSAYAEVHPIVSPDGLRLYFTRKNHPRNAGSRLRDDIWVSEREQSGEWKRAKNAGVPLNDAGHNYLNGISPDDNMALIAANYQNPDERERLYLARRNGESWSKPEPLDIPGLENQNEYAAFHLAADTRSILLSLEREGGYGYKDLYVSFKNESGQWSPPLNLGQGVNTIADETTPFLAPDGRTLYFTTTGRYGYGSSDIFVSKRLDDTWQRWSEPLNLGQAINSAGWDANFSLQADGEYAYFTSFNPASQSEDIGRIRLKPEGDQIEQVLVVNGRVLDRLTRKPLPASIIYAREADGREVGQAASELPSGHYQIVLPGGEAYRFFARTQGYYALTEVLDLRQLPEFGEVERNILMVPIRTGEIIPLPGVTFAPNSNALQESSFAELRRVALLLQDHPNLRMEIAGHTNDRCDQSFCQELSEKRARAVQAFLVEQGADPVRIIAVGYGKQVPVQDNSTEEGRAANQRVELRILKVD
ncbi:MAG: OmpA family protein [Bacteroidetes bacterium]|nr:OmpA family protein [Bacteroidota bacterium]